MSMYDLDTIQMHHTHHVHPNDAFGAAKNALPLVRHHVPWPVGRGRFLHNPPHIWDAREDEWPAGQPSMQTDNMDPHCVSKHPKHIQVVCGRTPAAVGQGKPCRHGLDLTGCPTIHTQRVCTPFFRMQWKTFVVPCESTHQEDGRSNVSLCTSMAGEHDMLLGGFSAECVSSHPGLFGFDFLHS